MAETDKERYNTSIKKNYTARYEWMGSLNRRWYESYEDAEHDVKKLNRRYPNLGYTAQLEDSWLVRIKKNIIINTG